MPLANKIETAVFGGGCFWCTEAVFSELKGVKKVLSGYAGGQMPDPSYEVVSAGATGHVEVIKIDYNPKEISYRDLLTVFFATHDSTTLNRQGADIGSQYRSVIFHTADQQKQAAERFLTELKKAGVNAVTNLEPLDIFYPAEDYHQNYYTNHRAAPYCELVIDPKLEKMQTKFGRLLKHGQALES